MCWWFLSRWMIRKCVITERIVGFEAIKNEGVCNYDK